ncbi:MAG: hypothetical protein IIY12_03640 [Clostridia bacterium]|nr:hypothetical protein [Clostridia bacterium]
MITKSNDRVWIYSTLHKRYYRLAAGLTQLKETYRSTVLETPNLQSGFCGQEVLYKSGQLEFEGYRVHDFAMNTLIEKNLKRGTDGTVTLVITNRNDLFAPGSNYCYGFKVEGVISFENPGSGVAPIGSPVKGKILYTIISDS